MPEGLPTQIGPEAREAAEMLDRMIEELLAECGLVRVNRTGGSAKALAQVVQYAIDKRMERIDA